MVRTVVCCLICNRYCMDTSTRVNGLRSLKGYAGLGELTISRRM